MKFYRIRTMRHGERVFIHARGYRDALKILREFGGKLMVSK